MVSVAFSKRQTQIRGRNDQLFARNDVRCDSNYCRNNGFAFTRIDLHRVGVISCKYSQKYGIYLRGVRHFSGIAVHVFAKVDQQITDGALIFSMLPNIVLIRSA